MVHNQILRVFTFVGTGTLILLLAGVCLLMLERPRNTAAPDAKASTGTVADNTIQRVPQKPTKERRRGGRSSQPTVGHVQGMGGRFLSKPPRSVEEEKAYRARRLAELESQFRAIRGGEVAGTRASVERTVSEVLGKFDRSQISISHVDCRGLSCRLEAEAADEMALSDFGDRLIMKGFDGRLDQGRESRRVRTTVIKLREQSRVLVFVRFADRSSGRS